MNLRKSNQGLKEGVVKERVESTKDENYGGVFLNELHNVLIVFQIDE